MEYSLGEYALAAIVSIFDGTAFEEGPWVPRRIGAARPGF